ncbi:hypothetical protein [Amycolatopsis alkalitolerans]|uniref:hypothetical protein n=1 Tax=Amycolatopsis alkalitolerans TaxID=2547244 RepID=UPI00190FAB6E|nr:hypothetical protein [Amycolatopsis alkalitolerans]
MINVDSMAWWIYHGFNPNCSLTDALDLYEDLLARLKNEPAAKTRVEALREFTLFNTVYRPEHVIRTLKSLRDDGLIESDQQALYRTSFVRLAS